MFCLSCGETPWQSEAGRMAVPFDGINLKESILASPWAGITPAQGDAVCRRLFLVGDRQGRGKAGA